MSSTEENNKRFTFVINSREPHTAFILEAGGHKTADGAVCIQVKLYLPASDTYKCLHEDWQRPEKNLLGKPLDRKWGDDTVILYGERYRYSIFSVYGVTYQEAGSEALQRAINVLRDFYTIIDSK